MGSSLLPGWGLGRCEQASIVDDLDFFRRMILDLQQPFSGVMAVTENGVGPLEGFEVVGEERPAGTKSGNVADAGELFFEERKVKMGYFSHEDDGVGGKCRYSLPKARSPFIDARIEGLQFPEVKWRWFTRGENSSGPENQYTGILSMLLSVPGQGQGSFFSPSQSEVILQKKDTHEESVVSSQRSVFSGRRRGQERMKDEG